MPVKSYRVAEQIHDKKPEFWYIDQNMSIDEYYDHVFDGDFVCDECGCPDVEYKKISWYKLNNNEYISDGEDDSDFWCPYCEDQSVNIIEMQEWKKKHEEKFFIKKGAE